MVGRLLTIGSVTESVGLYVGAKIGQKGIGFVRVLLLAYLMAEVPAQYGLVGVATVLMGVLTVAMTLGGNHGLVRYAAQFQARGQLRAFERTALKSLALVVGAMAVVVLAASGPLTTYVIAARGGSDPVPYRQLLWLCWAVIANAALEANYNNVMGLLNGLRAYRLIAALELTFAAMFTLAAAMALVVSRTVLAVLLGHVVCVSVILVVSLLGARAVAARLDSPGSGTAPPDATRTLRRLLGFGWPITLAALLGLVTQYASFYLAYRRFGETKAGVLWFFVQLSQPVLLVGQAAWAVILTHVTSRWEHGRREEAMVLLGASYKAISLALLAVSTVVYLTASWWVQLLPGRFQGGVVFLPGLLAFFQMLTSLAVVNILARIHERPALLGVMSLATLAGNASLAWWWMGPMGIEGAAWAAGTAGVTAGLLVGGIYVYRSGARLGAAVYVLLASPALLMAPAWVTAAAVTVLAVSAVWTGWLLRPAEREAIRRTLHRNR
ncbi:MAG: lipopolysaccharide biosynthesis protein [Phycisphaerae bacterium]